MPAIESSQRRIRALAAAANDASAGDDDWPTTQRFSRRIGEAMRSAEYAAAVERPAAKLSHRAALVVATLLVFALLYAVAIALGEAG